MSNPNFNLQDAVQDTVDELVSKCEPFTAYDITQTVRSANPGEDVPTLASRDLVHATYRGGFMPGYTRERAADIMGKPWRYSPDEDCIVDGAPDDSVQDSTRDDDQAIS